MANAGLGSSWPRTEAARLLDHGAPKLLRLSRRLALFRHMTDTRQPSSQVEQLQRTARRVLLDGVLWLVYEMPAQAYDRRQKPSLIFETDTAVRRVRNYPADWRALTDQDLLTLSWSA